jgi:hypothetical protein
VKELKGVFNPAIPEKANDILLGEGIVKANGIITGATQGGSKLEIDRTIKPTKYDGSYGDTKGLKKYERYVVRLTINFLKVNHENIAYGNPVTVSDGQDSDGIYKKIDFNLDVKASDVIDVLSFEGFKLDNTPCTIQVEKALNIGSMSFDFKEKGEIVLPMVYTGFYTFASPTTPPLKMWDYYPA